MRLFVRHVAPFRRTTVTTSGLVATTIVTSVTGFFFWWLAARQFPPAAVGVAGAAVSAMILLSQLAELGLGTKLAGVLHRERAAPLVATALLTTGMAAALLGLAFALAAPAMFQELESLAARPHPLLIFVAGVSLSTVGSILDQFLAAMSRDFERLARNLLFAFGRLALLPVGALAFPNDAGAIYGAWVAGVVVSLVALIPLREGLTLQRGEVLRWREIRRMAEGTVWHHMVNLSRSSSLWILPLVVTVVLSKETNASFYIALLLANFVALIGSSATFTLYIVTAASPSVLAQQIRFTLGLSAAVVGLGAIGLWAAGQPLLSMFGPTYAAAAYPAIVVLGATSIPLLVKDHWIALQRIRGTMRSAAWIGVGGLVLEVTAAAVGAAYGGIEGLALARFVAVLLQSGFMAAPVLRAAAGPGSSPAGSTGEPTVDRAS